MNTEVELNLDDDALWESVEDNVQSRIESALEDYEPWEQVSGDVENYCDDRIGEMESNHSMDTVDEHLQSLLNQLRSRVVNGDSICALGTSAQDAIVAVVKKAAEAGTLDAVIPNSSTQERVDQAQIDQNLDVQRRINVLERQVKSLLASVIDMGERAAAVTPDSVV